MLECVCSPKRDALLFDKAKEPFLNCFLFNFGLYKPHGKSLTSKSSIRPKKMPISSDIRLL